MKHPSVASVDPAFLDSSKLSDYYTYVIVPFPVPPVNNTVPPVPVIDPVPVTIIYPVPVPAIDPVPVTIIDPVPVPVIDPLTVPVIDPVPLDPTKLPV
ncbi:uncharacterized protein [Mytilus edulis]|uniref:uncharacterized protein n=1 Tax=Mytilus edulis TaxID=6550 RepID=UPI0039EE8DC0